MARYHAQQCSELAVVTSGLLADQDGTDPFVTDTVPAEMISPERFGRSVPEQTHPGAEESHAPAAHPRRLSEGMIESYVETLVERLTGTEKAQPDADGDYPIRFRNALYYVRVVHAADPVVQLFSIALSDSRSPKSSRWTSTRSTAGSGSAGRSGSTGRSSSSPSTSHSHSTRTTSVPAPTPSPAPLMSTPKRWPGTTVAG